MKLNQLLITMKNNARILKAFTLIIALSLAFNSCQKDDKVKLADLNVQVTFSEAFSGLDLSNLYVYITNTLNSGIDSVLTDINGIAMFTDIAPGTYNISCYLNLTAEEAGMASGYYEEMTLNAVKNNVELFAGMETSESIELDGKPGSSLVIKEFYYSGANDPTWSILFKDQFIEIYNNSAEVVYADGLYIACLAPSSNGSSSSDPVLGLPLNESVYANKIAQVPGNGTSYPIEPGESIIIAFNAVDWTNDGAKTFTVDLSIADLELYAIDWLESLGRSGNAFFDIDNVDVPNMNMIYLNIENYGFFDFFSTGASVAIFRSETAPSVIITDPNSSETNPVYYMKINTADIIDGIDMLYDAESADFKRLPSSIDAGFNYVEGSSYTSKSVRRKVAKIVNDRAILMDTNNSTNDFTAIDLPTPGSLGL